MVVQLSRARPAEPEISAPIVRPIAVTSGAPAVTVVDVAAGVPALSIPELVRLSPGERIASVDDRVVASDLAAGAAIVEAARAHQFVDLAVEGVVPRRVLVLLHRGGERALDRGAGEKTYGVQSAPNRLQAPPLTSSH